jgi:DNA-binding transcriptional LysR family regulator
MELSDLHIFRTVVREGGIVRAARRLHRVPSNITTRIKQLEASIGVQLFTREHHRLTLSQRGERLLVYADRLLLLSEEARSVLSGTAPAGVLRLGALESTAASRLPAILAAYHKAYPDVSVELITGTNDALTGAVIDRRMEAAFVAEAPATKELAYQALFRERLVIISAASHAPIRRPQDVDADSVIAFPNGCYYRRVLQRWLGERRMSSIRVLRVGLLSRDRSVCRVGHGHRTNARVCARNRAARRRHPARTAEGTQRCRDASYLARVRTVARVSGPA